jgi:hypothetical protein
MLDGAMSPVRRTILDVVGIAAVEQKRRRIVVAYAAAALPHCSSYSVRPPR